MWSWTRRSCTVALMADPLAENLPALKRKGKHNGPVEAPADQVVAKVVPDGSPRAAGEPGAQGQEPHALAKTYFARIFPGPERPLPPEFGAAAEAIGAAFEAPAWLLVQKSRAVSPFALLSEVVRDGFFDFRSDLVDCERVVVIVDSPGGYGPPAYSLARLFQRHCGGWTAIVPRYGKSAATLFIMGADQLYMGRDAELGPLDAQLMDPEREEVTSALDEVQALERMHSSALDQIDQTMQLLLARTGKKVETLLPIVTKFVSDTMAPLLDKIDTVHYSQQSRVLKVAEDYAVRLMLPRMAREDAEYCARHFVNHYSEHGFVIDAEEANQYLGLGDPTEEQAVAIANMEEWLTHNDAVALGPLQVVTEAANEAEDEAGP